MRLEDCLYFSTNIKYEDIDFSNPDNVLSALHDRLENYYLKPADYLNEKQLGFASGVLVLTGIDFISSILYPNSKPDCIQHFCLQLKGIQELKTDKEKIVNTIKVNFRDGLVHEGRINNLSQFSYDFDCLITEGENFIIINPKHLIAQARQVINERVLNLDKSSKELMLTIVHRKFKKEINNLSKTR